MNHFFHVIIVFICFALYYVCPAKKILLHETNNKSCQQLENEYNWQQMECNKAQLFTWCLPDCYNKDIEPWVNLDLTNGVLPFYYNFEFVINSIHEVNDFEGTLVIEMFFVIKWWEPRIQIKKISSASEVNLKENEELVTIPLSNLQVFWNPDLDIFGIKAYRSEKVLNNVMASLKIDANGTVRYSNRAIITLSCDMDFERYPFDSHQCFFRAGSYAYHDKIVNCTSKVSYAYKAKQRNLQYVVKLGELPSAYQEYVSLNEQRWASCGFTVNLKRTKSQMITQVYLTSTSLVIISWISFIVNPSAIPGRMGMLVTVFLVLINIFIGVKNSSPVSNGLNAADIFLVTCLVWVFGALLEYAVVLIMNRKPANVTVSETANKNKVFASEVTLNDPIWSLKSPQNLLETSKILQDVPIHSEWNAIDKISLVFFPFMFVVFLITYILIFLD